MSPGVRGISSMALRQLLAELAEAWARRGETEIGFESVGGVDAARRVRDGEAFDLVVLASEAIDALATGGRLVAGSARVLARSSVAIAVRQGSAHPDVGSEDGLRRAVLAAPRIGCSTGPSGQALRALFARWGLADTLQMRLVQAPPGVPVATLLARGDVDLGFQQLSELAHVDGIDVVGPMPRGAEIVTLFSGAVCATAARPDAAAAFLEFVKSPAGDEARQRHGLEPA